MTTEDTRHKGKPGGYPELDGRGLVPKRQLPPYPVFSGGTGGDDEDIATGTIDSVSGPEATITLSNGDVITATEVLVAGGGSSGFPITEDDGSVTGTVDYGSGNLSVVTQDDDVPGNNSSLNIITYNDDGSSFYTNQLSADGANQTRMTLDALNAGGVDTGYNLTVSSPDGGGELKVLGDGSFSLSADDGTETFSVTADSSALDVRTTDDGDPLHYGAANVSLGSASLTSQDTSDAVAQFVAQANASGTTSAYFIAYDADSSAQATLDAAGSFSLTADDGSYTVAIVGVAGGLDIQADNSINIGLVVPGTEISIGGSLMQITLSGDLRIDSEELGFFDIGSVTQRGPIADPTGGVVIDAEARTAIASILTALEQYGLLDT